MKAEVAMLKNEGIEIEVAQINEIAL